MQNVAHGIPMLTILISLTAGELESVPSIYALTNITPHRCYISRMLQPYRLIDEGIQVSD